MNKLKYIGNGKNGDALCWYGDGEAQYFPLGFCLDLMDSDVCKCHGVIHISGCQAFLRHNLHHWTSQWRIGWGDDACQVSAQIWQQSFLSGLALWYCSGNDGLEI